MNLTAYLDALRPLVATHAPLRPVSKQFPSVGTSAIMGRNSLTVGRLSYTVEEELSAT